MVKWRCMATVLTWLDHPSQEEEEKEKEKEKEEESGNIAMD